MGVFAADFIPQFARFGPLCGDSRTPSVEEATVMPKQGAVAAVGAESAGSAAAASIGPANQSRSVWKVFQPKLGLLGAG